MSWKQLFKLRDPSSEAGFSLVEMMVVMVLLGIVASTATSQYSDLVASFDRQNAVNRVEFDLRRARATSIAEGSHGIFKVNAGGEGYEFGTDYLPYTTGPSATYDIKYFNRTLPNRTSLGTATIMYDSRGYVIDPTTGSPTSVTLSLRFNGSEYCQVGVNSVGTITITCE